MFVYLSPSEVIEKSDVLISECKKNRMFFSMGRLLIIKSLANQWIGEPLEIQNSVREIRKYFNKRTMPPFLNFFVKFLEAHAYSLLEKYTDSLQIVKELLRKSYLGKKPYFYRELASVLFSIGEFKRAFSLLLKIENYEGYAYQVNRAVFYAIKGEYDSSLKIIKEIKN